MEKRETGDQPLISRFTFLLLISSRTTGATFVPSNSMARSTLLWAAVVSGLLRGRWSVTPVTDLPAEIQADSAISPTAGRRLEPSELDRKGGANAKAVAPAALLTPGDARLYLVLFLGFWVVGAWVAYSYADEKMPWLLTHMAQPMSLFGGW